MDQTIEAGRGLLRQWLKEISRALREAQLRRAQAHALARLDARSLRDIGLPAEAEEQHRRSAMRMVALRLGMH